MTFPIGRIYDRKLLWPERQRELSRRQFDELDATDQEKLKEIKTIDESLNVPDDLNQQDLLKLSRPFGTGSLDHYDVGQLLGIKALNDKLVNAYIHCIVSYVNKLRRPGAPDQDPKLSGELAELPKTGYQDIKPMKVVDSEQQKYPSCRLMSLEDFRKCTSVEKAKEVLEKIDCSGERFKNLDYLFVVYGDGGHNALLGIAPRQKFVFVVDSIDRMALDSDDSIRGLLIRILFSQINKTETWPIYTQWRRDTEETLDGSPNCARQGDIVNCGVFTATNAFCLAFGLDLRCYRQGDLEGLKRSRMVMELYQGSLGGKYAYDLLDMPDELPGRIPASQPQVAEHPGTDEVYPGGTNLVDYDSDASAAMRELEDITGDFSDGDAQQDWSEGDEENGDSEEEGWGEDETSEDLTSSHVPSPEIPLGSISLNEEDMHEAHGMDDIMDSESGSGYLSPLASTGPSSRNRRLRQLDDVIPSAEKLIYKDLMRRMPAIRQAWNADEEYVHETKIARLEHPPQFDPKYFRRDGFLYPSAPDTPSDEILAQYNIEERKAAYARFPLQGIEEWEHESPEVIDRWAQNKMAAFVAQYWDDDVKPDKWLVRGYDQWHEEHLVREKESHAFLWDIWETEGNPDFKSRRDALYQLGFIRENMKAAGTKWKDMR